MDKSLNGPHPGLFLVNSKIESSELSEKVFDDWYEQIHIPDVFKTNAFKEAYRWRAVDPNAERPHLILYPMTDVGFLAKQEFKDIPVQSDALPGSGNIFDLASFDTRGYKQVQLYEPDDAKTGQADFVVVAGFTPADDGDYEAWYQQEHLKEISGISTWRKTERYESLFARVNQASSAAPKYLTLHFFDGDKLPEQELAKASESEWTQKNMSTMKEAQVAVFKKKSSFAT